MENRGSYRIHLQKNGVVLEVEAPDPAYVDSKLLELMDILGLEAELQEGGTGGGNGSPAKPLGLAELVSRVGPQGGLEHVLTVGYYLERHRSMHAGFRRRDLSHAFRSIKYHHSNPGMPIAAGRKQGLLIDGEEADKIRLSESADQWVEARLRGE